MEQVFGGGFGFGEFGFGFRSESDLGEEQGSDRHFCVLMLYVICVLGRHTKCTTFLYSRTLVRYFQLSLVDLSLD